MTFGTFDNKVISEISNDKVVTHEILNFSVNDSISDIINKINKREDICEQTKSVLSLLLKEYTSFIINNFNGILVKNDNKYLYIKSDIVVELSSLQVDIDLYKKNRNIVENDVNNDIYIYLLIFFICIVLVGIYMVYK